MGGAGRQIEVIAPSVGRGRVGGHAETAVGGDIDIIRRQMKKRHAERRRRPGGLEAEVAERGLCVTMSVNDVAIPGIERRETIDAIGTVAQTAGRDLQVAHGVGRRLGPDHLRPAGVGDTGPQRQIDGLVDGLRESGLTVGELLLRQGSPARQHLAAGRDRRRIVTKRQGQGVVLVLGRRQQRRGGRLRGGDAAQTAEKGDDRPTGQGESTVSHSSASGKMPTTGAPRHVGDQSPSRCAPLIRATRRPAVDAINRRGAEGGK
jgi:hypothetical protein